MLFGGGRACLRGRGDATERAGNPQERSGATTGFTRTSFCTVWWWILRGATSSRWFRIRSRGEKFTGTWIAEEYRKYSEKRAQKPTESDKQYKRYLQTREKALARAKGYRLDEVAEAIARKTGRDTLEVQEELVDYQNLKEGTSWGREGAARRLAAMTLDSIERV